ncbi:MAG: hypothetical protein NTY47_05360, partial [Candidatus Omnitrophica bacterium]|nr:hypothetical protein [Candidatus Omnitrophota bacterium]
GYMENLSAKIKYNRSRAQVLLETAIVLISIAALAIGSMALFSNQKLNLIGRQDTYRQSNVAAVNSSLTGYSAGNALNPRTYLEYSTHTSIIAPTNPNPGFGQDYAEEPLLSEADILFAKADLLLDKVSFYKTYRIYQLLSGNVINISLNSAKLALKIANSMQEDLNSGYGYYANNMSGVDIDHVPTGGVGLMQYVFDHPVEGGPFDVDLNCETDDNCKTTEKQNQDNRNNLADQIVRLKDSIVPNLHTMIYGDPASAQISIASELNGNVISPLNQAITRWNRRYGFFFGTLYRIQYLTTARNAIAYGVSTDPAQQWASSGSTVAQINSLQTSIHPEGLSYDDNAGLISKVSLLLRSPELANENNMARKMLIEISQNLALAQRYWEGANKQGIYASRDYYLDFARMEIGVLYDMVRDTQ